LRGYSIMTGIIFYLRDRIAMSPEDIERRLKSIIASARIEDMEVTEEDIVAMRGILSGDVDADTEVERLFAERRAEIEMKKTGTN